MNEVIGGGLACDKNPVPDTVVVENFGYHWISGGELGVNGAVRGSVVKMSLRTAVGDGAHARPNHKAGRGERLVRGQLPIQTWRIELESSGCKSHCQRANGATSRAHRGTRCTKCLLAPRWIPLLEKGCGDAGIHDRPAGNWNTDAKWPPVKMPPDEDCRDNGKNTEQNKKPFSY